MPIGERLKAIRKQRGWSKNRLATAAHIGRGHLSKIEEGDIVNPTVDVLRRLAGALGVTLEQLAVGPAAADDSLAEYLASTPADLAAALHRARGTLPTERYVLLVETLVNVIGLSDGTAAAGPDAVDGREGLPLPPG